MKQIFRHFAPAVVLLALISTDGAAADWIFGGVQLPSQVTLTKVPANFASSR